MQHVEQQQQLQDYNFEILAGPRTHNFYLAAIQVFLRMAAEHNGCDVVTVVWDGVAHRVPADYVPGLVEDSLA